MKKEIKTITILITLIFTLAIGITKVYADPNSSKGFAEYDDTQAEEENKKLLEEQKKEIQESQGKSTNNYLESLQVEGYELSPAFNKQILEYTIAKEISGRELNIKATASDEKAKIKGAGKITLEENQTQIRIDVTAESGTVRTYMINIKQEEKSQNPTEEENPNENIQTEPEEEPTEETASSVVEAENGNIDNNNGNTTQKSNSFLVFIIIIAIMIAIIITLAIKRKGKH